MAIFRLAIADESYFRNDAGTVRVRNIVANLPFEIKFFIQQSFHRCNGQTKAVGGFFFHTNFAGHVRKRQADADGIGLRFDENELVVRVGAERLNRQANQGEQNDSNLFHQKLDLTVAAVCDRRIRRSQSAATNYFSGFTMETTNASGLRYFCAAALTSSSVTPSNFAYSVSP